MSLQTGILSNPNNDISHRMARNSRRQAATAEKERESDEAAKPKASGRRGKSTRAGAVLSASSSGRVKTPRVRPGDLFILVRHTDTHIDTPAPPVLPTQSDTMSPEPIVLPLPTQIAEPLVPDFTLAGPAVDPAFNLFSSFDFGFNDTTTFQGFDARGSFPSQNVPDAHFTPSDPTFFGLSTDFNALIPVEDPLQDFNAPRSFTSQDLPGGQFTTFHPTLFRLSTDLNALFPSHTPVKDPLQDFMNLFEPSGLAGDFG